MKRIALSLLWLAGGIAAPAVEAAPILMKLEGTIEIVDDAFGLAKSLELSPGESVVAVYELDRDAGLIRFGDGRHGARLPGGGRVTAGAYRSGGKEGSVLVLDDCWVAELTCIPGEGGDAYFTHWRGGSSDGVDFDLLIALTTSDDTVIGGDEISAAPPALRRFQSAWFRWILTDGERSSELSGIVTTLEPVPAPSTLALLAFGIVACRRKRAQLPARGSGGSRAGRSPRRAAPSKTW